MAGKGIKLLERVGEGGMSTVWKAWDESRGCYVAVKVLAGEFAASGRDIASFREEERVMEEMDNPGIVKAYGFEQDGKTIAMLMPREDLANMSNMTTANAIRTLSQFAQEGIISIDGRHIQITDETALEKISRLG